MIRRYEHNPILTKADVPYPVATVHNPGAVKHSAYSRHGVRVALARTRDFEEVERVALITQADSRNVVLFPELSPPWVAPSIGSERLSMI